MATISQPTSKEATALQIDQHLIRPKFETISLGQVINRVLIELHPVAVKKQILLVYPSLPRTITINTDPVLLEKILTELLGNALNFSLPKGEVVLRVELQADGAHLEVEDEGIGIPQTEQIEIFSKYFRGSNVGEVAGQGLGLYLVLNYVKLLNGRIWFISKEDCGTIFSVFIPTGKPKPVTS